MQRDGVRDVCADGGGDILKVAARGDTALDRTTDSMLEDLGGVEKLAPCPAGQCQEVVHVEDPVVADEVCSGLPASQESFEEVHR